MLVTQHLCVKHAFPRWRACMEGKNEQLQVKIPPRKTRHVRFGENDINFGRKGDRRPVSSSGEGAVTELSMYRRPYPGTYGKLRLYLTMSLCVLCNLEDLSAILCTCLFQEDLPVCVPEGPVTYLRDTRTSDLDPLPTEVWFFLLLQSSLRVRILKTEKQKSLY
ncbi:hypothetical protein Bbelb_086040 [Branchiostoma belcheri]|nr:hypothetical protein Bbelb_086040 [Branchiostoma belcheri]